MAVETLHGSIHDVLKGWKRILGCEKNGVLCSELKEFLKSFIRVISKCLSAIATPELQLHTIHELHKLQQLPANYPNYTKYSNYVHKPATTTDTILKVVEYSFRALFRLGAARAQLTKKLQLGVLLSYQERREF